MHWAVAALLLAALAGRAAGQANPPEVPGENGGWRAGRATFYSGPERFLQSFADRGPPPEYGFGSAVFGSCGYTQQVRHRHTILIFDWGGCLIGACL